MKEIKLTNSDKVTLVDDYYYDFLIKFRWRLMKTKNNEYAFTDKSIPMHKLILGSSPNINPKVLFPDHIDRNGLNNQIANLRWATKGQNACNSKKISGCSSNYKGVQKIGKKWRARCKFNGIEKSLHFDTELEAAHGYDIIAKEIQGDFAVLNFPKSND